MHIFWARLASFGHLGLISNPLIVSKFHNETHDPKGHENKNYTIVKGSEMFCRRHTVPVISRSEVKYVLKRVSFGSKEWHEIGLIAEKLSTFIKLSFVIKIFVLSIFEWAFYTGFTEEPQHCNSNRHRSK